MAFEKRYQQAPEVTASPCIHLRSKAIYVSGDLKDPYHPDETGAHYCWCNLTQHIVGPDNQEVDRPLCISGRPCHVASP